MRRYRGRRDCGVFHLVDVHTASVARMYDYFLGGTDNYEADQIACARLLQISPRSKEIALTNRSFLVRAVRYLASQARIDQYIDHGSGLPTQNNVHQVCQKVNRNARVVYVDNDPIVLAHGGILLDENNNTAILETDFRESEYIFTEAERLGLYSPRKPAAALFVSVLHCLEDDDQATQLVHDVISRLGSGSYLVLSALASDDPAFREEATNLMHHLTEGNWGRVRSCSEIAACFDGLDVIDDLGDVAAWRPGSNSTPSLSSGGEWFEYGGVARIP